MWFVHLGWKASANKNECKSNSFSKQNMPSGINIHIMHFLYCSGLSWVKRATVKVPYSLVFCCRETFQHLYLVLLGDIPANVYSSPQSNGNLVNNVHNGTCIITVTFSVPKSHDYGKGMRNGKGKVNLMPKEDIWKMSHGRGIFPPLLCGTCVYCFLLRWEWFITFWRAIKSICLFRSVIYQRPLF